MSAFQRPGGKNLNLERQGVSVWWQGLGGFELLNIKGRLRHLLSFEDPPIFLLLHCGANDVGSATLGYLQYRFKKILLEVNEILPNTKLVWSQLLPRIKWQVSHNNEAMEKCRNRLNRLAAKNILQGGGYYIKHPDLFPFSSSLYKTDGVHLNELGNNVFLNTIQSAFETFLTSDSHVYPPFPTHQ
ncbi:hypothetical protein FSP39_024416 [Pinctada imbricata]|uniref:SGNH hydrolase-type esterase domain-containing protein n=1 Tax=Pinctada imbricata TaxID=66713 RepID=A0AA88Y0V5_PINIB|nr:hypothetical protein FSP39_024416 [Pinctada imbricata]